jgi:murein tripeptide amidase MpaA
VDYLHRLSEEYAPLTRLFSAGKSFERRNISGIHLFGKSGPGKKPAIVFLGTIHAREWITSMVTEYIAYSLLRNYDVDKDVEYALNSFDFYIVPVANPDGTNTPTHGEFHVLALLVC